MQYLLIYNLAQRNNGISKKPFVTTHVCPVLEIKVGHWPISDQFDYMTGQYHFGWPILLYILIGIAINNL